MNNKIIKQLFFLEGSKVAPGDKIGGRKVITAGKGYYECGKYVYACAVRELKISQLKDGSAEASISLEEGRQYASSQVLSIGNKVLGQVICIMNNNATVEIVAAEEIGNLREHHSGIICKEDVSRVSATEEVQIYESF